jgi:hypothetical protein
MCHKYERRITLESKTFVVTKQTRLNFSSISILATYIESYGVIRM